MITNLYLLKSNFVAINRSSLRRQVFFLKDERKKLMDEIQSLRAIVQNARLKDESLESLNLANNKTVCIKPGLT